MLSKLAERFNNNTDIIKTFYCHENNRIVTAVYKITQCDFLSDRLELKVEAAGCMFSDDSTNVQWNKRAHRSTALARLSQYPIKLNVTIPNIEWENIKKEVMKVGSQPGQDIFNLYIRYARKIIEYKVRKSFRYGMKNRNVSA